MLTALATAFARNLRVASLVVAAAMIGVGGAAATVVTVADSTATADPSVTVTADDPGDQGEDADDQGEDADGTEATEVETEDADDVEAEDATEVEADDADETEATEESTLAAAPVVPVVPVACEDATSHGEYVSSVAQATQGLADHSTQVRTAAHSDCGKADATEDTETTGTTETTETTTATAAPTTHGKGHLKPAKVKATTHGKSADHRGLHGKSAGKARHNHS